MASAPISRPVVLTIAGSDSGGGAGIQADLKTFSALGAFGTTAITAITAQNPDGVTDIQGINPGTVAAQISAVCAYFEVGAAKTGMLFSAEIIHAVADALEKVGCSFPLVVDPVMVATSGARLLKEDAIQALRSRVLPRAAVITPNMGEASLLAEMEVTRLEHLEPVARALYQRFGVPALVKGGHLTGTAEATDCLFDGVSVRYYKSRFLQGVNTHGTGCTLSAAITVYLMGGKPLGDAVALAKTYLQGTLAHSLPVGRDNLMNHGFGPVRLAGP